MAGLSTDHLARLEEAQNQGLQKSKEKLAQWKKIRKDYVELESRLGTLPDMLSYDIMVPFGSVAFMPGKLVRTNELLVLLGDDWFVERSAKQASQIVSRRIKRCDKVISDTSREIKQLRDWRKATAGIRNEVGENAADIVEPYNEESEKIWREKHALSVQKERQTQNKQPLVANDDEFWQKLDALELQELEQEEMQNSSELSASDADYSSSLSDETSEESEEEDGNVPDTAIVEQKRPRKIRWKEDLVSVEAKHDSVSKIPEIKSPADIYELFATPKEVEQPKSIMKPVTKGEAKSEAAQGSSKSSSGVVNAVSDVIVERKPSQLSNPAEETSSDTKRVSKFKAQRLAKRS